VLLRQLLADEAGDMELGADPRLAERVPTLPANTVAEYRQLQSARDRAERPEPKAQEWGVGGSWRDWDTSRLPPLAEADVKVGAKRGVLTPVPRPARRL
jgi:hypothetical protein